GGTALYTRTPIEVRLHAGGKIAGGGGAGGPGTVGFVTTGTGASGGPGAGREAGIPQGGASPATDTVGGDPSPPGFSPGGKGGDLGEPGADGVNFAGSGQTTTGAAPGNAIDGDSFVTFTVEDGDVL